MPGVNGVRAFPLSETGAPLPPVVVLDLVVLEAVQPGEEVAVRLGSSSELQAIDCQRQFAVVAHVDPHPGTGALEFGVVAVHTRNQMEVLGGAQRDRDIARADIGVVVGYPAPLPRGFQCQVIEVAVVVLEITDTDCRVSVEEVEQSFDLRGDSQSAEFVRLE